MKKKYVNPEIEVVKFVSNPLLNDASPTSGYDPNSSVDPVYVEASQFQDNGGSEDW